MKAVKWKWLYMKMRYEEEGEEEREENEEYIMKWSEIERPMRETMI